MAVYPWQATVQDQDGNGVGSAQVTVRIGGSGGDLATIYSDAAETSKTNPFNATVDGFAQFWAKAGTYYIEGVSSAQTTDGWYVVLGGSDNQVTLTATVAAGEAVTADGALATEATAAEYLGLAQDAGVTDDIVNVQSTGNFTLGTWSWTPDEYVYLTNAGALTQTPPTGTHRRIGIATTTTTIALDAGPVVTEVGGGGAENAIPALSDAGLIDYTMIEKAATGGAGAEDLLVQADADGLIDPTLLAAVIDTSKQFTASGAITAGDAVALSGNKTVEVIATVTGVFDISAASAVSEFDEAKDCDTAYSTADNVHAIFYADSGNSDYASLVLIDATGLSRAYGAVTVISTAAAATKCKVDYDPINDVFVLAWLESTTLKTVVVDVTGTIASTVGTTVSLGAITNVSQIALACDKTNGGVMLASTVTSGSSQARFSDVVGTVLSFGTAVTFSSVDTRAVALGYNAFDDGFIIAYGAQGSSTFVGRFLTVSGTTVTANASTTIASGLASQGLLSNLIVNPNTGVCVATIPSGSTSCRVYTGYVSGTSTVWPDYASASAGYFSTLGFNEFDEEWGLLIAASSGDTTFHTVTVTANVVALDAGEVVTADLPSATSNASFSSKMSWNTIENIFVGMYFRRSFTPINYVFSINPAASSTNAREFVGFAETTVADAAAVNVDMLGDINASQTGLTYATDYYIDADGTLNASDTGYGKVGRALSATEIIVTKNTWIT